MISIREAAPSDVSMIYRLATDLATSFAISEDVFEDSFRKLLAHAGSWVLVAEDAGRVIGYLLGHEHLTFYANGLVSCVEEIMVDPDFRAQGVGKMLMCRFEHDAAARGSRLVAVATRRASAFYSRIGYEESATYFRKLL